LLSAPVVYARANGRAGHTREVDHALGALLVPAPRGLSPMWSRSPSTCARLTSMARDADGQRIKADDISPAHLRPRRLGPIPRVPQAACRAWHQAW